MLLTGLVGNGSFLLLLVLIRQRVSIWNALRNCMSSCMRRCCCFCQRGQNHDPLVDQVAPGHANRLDAEHIVPVLPDDDALFNVEF